MGVRIVGAIPKVGRISEGYGVVHKAVIVHMILGEGGKRGRGGEREGERGKIGEGGEGKHSRKEENPVISPQACSTTTVVSTEIQ